MDTTKWCDVFADEGHREGARLLFTAWCTFLQSEPPTAFIEAWAQNLRYVVWEEAESKSCFDLAWTQMDGKVKPILPLTEDQARVVFPDLQPLCRATNYPGVALNKEQLEG